MDRFGSGAHSEKIFSEEKVKCITKSLGSETNRIYVEGGVRKRYSPESIRGFLGRCELTQQVPGRKLLWRKLEL